VIAVTAKNSLIVETTSRLKLLNFSTVSDLMRQAACDSLAITVVIVSLSLSAQAAVERIWGGFVGSV